MTETLPPLLLIGCGKMGGAMLTGWRERGLGETIVVDPFANGPIPRATLLRDPAEIPRDFAPAAVILATKPQEAPATLPAYARFAGGAVFVSIMAGKTVGFMQGLLGAGAAVVRAMPNTPAAVRQGFTVAFAGPGVTAAQRSLADTLLAATGEVDWVEQEGLLDPVTAVSGGGPAYVFLLAELLEAAAVEQGIPPDLARRMSRATVAGSGALLAASAEDAAQLRKNVTSPKGTTERALAVLMAESAWPQAISQAIAAATARSRELAG
ncbi:pyrroline-5-carboxylate reductase [Falsiroseomonas tokyonensis]|uniref:Pyrroline-5-carboxylate reductase n=1 Tax=Falsiroseomonas tokyonensis TaxID=430521 RepID=A0ABV7BYJ0_9PROT|nr:pyrroline-5-carboxylate reductase [Falsiroseomonas tokyonensis]MBU8539702.1 pyrroline-5-carboxylate reductase [Falsiroseomonas tokyonensis]